MNDDDPRPSYVQVADLLRAAIKRDDFRPGQRIPSGRDLAKQYGVSLLTAQRAVDTLKLEGVLVSHPPRGVFVSSGEPPAASDPSPRYTEIMEHLASLETTFQDAMNDLDNRVAALEDEVRRSRRSRKQES